MIRSHDVVIESGADTQIPEGYEVRCTPYGQLYLAKKNDFKLATVSAGTTEELEAINEHVINRLPFSATLTQLREEWGLSIWFYFDFVRYITFVNAMLFVLQAINYLAFIISANQYIVEAFKTTLGIRTLDILFTSSYPPSLRTIWVVTNSICVALMFCYGPVYFLRARYYYKKFMNTDEGDEPDLSKSELDIIRENADVSFFSRVVRASISYSIFVLVLAGIFAAIWFLTELDVRISAEGKGTSITSGEYWRSFAISLSISLAIVIINQGWKRACFILTKFEKHTKYSRLRMHNLVKLVLFKVLLIFVTSTAKLNVGTKCPLQVYGFQAFTLIILDIVVFNIIEVVVPKVMQVVKKKQNYDSDFDIMPEFDVSEEYLEVIYRQMIMYSGMAAFPMATLLNLIASIIEYFLDKFRLTRVCRRPPPSNASMKNLLTIFLILIAVLAAGNPGSGNIFLMVGQWWCDRTGADYSMCRDSCPMFNATMTS